MQKLYYFFFFDLYIYIYIYQFLRILQKFVNQPISCIIHILFLIIKISN